MKKVTVLTSLFFCCLQFIYAQLQKLDSSFGKNGIVETNIGKDYDYGSLPVTKLLLLPDESMFVIQGYLTKRRANGSIDSSFGLNGFSAYAGFVLTGAALQADGKIVAAGTITKSYYQADFAVARFNADGSLDSSFSDDGKLTTNFSEPDAAFSKDEARSAAIQKDGKIVVSGVSNNNTALARYNANGSLDTAFGNNGLQTNSLTGASAIAIQDDGKIVVGGSSNNEDFAILRYSTDGSLDKTFGHDGIQETNFLSDSGSTSGTDVANAVAIQKDGKIVAAGYTFFYDSNYNRQSYFALARYNADGSPDSSFSGDGRQTNFAKPGSVVNALAVQDDGKIVIAGSINNVFTIARYNVNGSLDKSFSEDGIKTTDFDSIKVNYPDGANAVVIQPDGKIVAGGGIGKFSTLTRVEKNGNADNTFDKDGKLTYSYIGSNTSLIASAIQKDGKILAVGRTWNGTDNISFVARYNTNGAADKAFSENGILYPDFNTISLTTQSDGKIVIVGSSNGDFAVARYNADGSLDKTFSEDGIQTAGFGTGTRNGLAKSVVIQSDDKIVVVGETITYKSEFDDYGESIVVARYNTDGSLDWKSVRNSLSYGIYSSANSVAIQKNGKIVVAGDVNEGSYYRDFAVFRYNKNGSPDYTFGDQGEQHTHFDDYYTTINSITIQQDDKIVAAGTAVTEEDGSDATLVAIIRYKSNGSVDSSFSQNGILKGNSNNNAEATSVAIQNNVKILVGGTDLLRYNTNGSLDSSFGNIQDHTPGFYINSITISNGKLNVAGPINHHPQNEGAVARYIIEDGSPAISLTSPANNTTYLAPAAHIKLGAAASDVDGSITKVEFYKDSTLLLTETVSPYGYIWRNVPLGNYTITAKATDNSGNVTTSAPVHISVVPNKPPFISIIMPIDNQRFTAPANVHFEAAAGDKDGRITRVEFYNGTILLRTEYKFPYIFNWENVPAGTYTITAIATDNWGAKTTSAPVTIIVTNASIVSTKPYSENEKTTLNDALTLRLSPNPATNIVNIYTNEIQPNKPATLSIISVSGIVLKNIQISKSVTLLDVSSLTSGVYTIKIVSGNQVLYKQFVKL